jgi:predicted nuclease of predicted toxin-antitoxin system
VKLLLDEHYANEIASRLRAAGHDAVTVSERGVKGIDDEPLLALAASEDRTLLTNNARDFLPIVARWASSGEDHYGVLLTSDDSMPRSKEGIGLYLRVLRALMDANPGIRALVNQVRWLP